MKGIIGKKIGMTSVFTPDGKQTACTIIEAGPCTVTQVKSQEIDGYNALQVAFGEKKEKHSNSALDNHFAKASTGAKKFVKEFRNSTLDKKLGETITVDIFTEGEKVDVVGTTKGKGFRVLLNVTDLPVWVSSLTVSTTGRKLRVLLVTHQMHHVYSKECAWRVVWVLKELRSRG